MSEKRPDSVFARARAEIRYNSSKRSVYQGGHSSGKPGKVRELKSGQGKVRKNRKNQEKVRENELLQLFTCRDYC